MIKLLCHCSVIVSQDDSLDKITALIETRVLIIQENIFINSTEPLSKTIFIKYKSALHNRRS